MFDGLEVIPNKKCWVEEKKKREEKGRKGKKREEKRRKGKKREEKGRKGKNDFRNRFIAIVLLRLLGGVGLKRVSEKCCY